MTQSPQSKTTRIVLRPSSGVWYVGITAALIVFFTGDAAIRGAWDVVVTALPWELLVVWLMYVVLMRPCLIVEPHTITVRNILREHIVPWTAINNMTTRFQLTLHLAGGRKITSWGSPSAGIDRPRVGRSRPRVSRPADRVIEDARDEVGRPTTGGPTGAQSHWDLLVIGVSVALVIWCALTIIL